MISDSVRHDIRSFDYFMVLMVLAVAFFGVLMIATFADLQHLMYGNANLPENQRNNVIFGFLIMIVMALVNYRFVAKFAIPIYIAAILLLVGVWIIGPDDITGTARWIFLPIPGGVVSIQPSELAKIALIIFFAQFLDTQNVNRFHWLMLFLALAALPVVMVAVQPSLSAALVLASVAVIMLFLGGLYFRYIIATLLLVIPAGVMVYFDILRERRLFIDQILAPHQIIRIETFLYPVPGSDEFFQMERSLLAMNVGGMNGRGLGENQVFVIHGHNDFILAVVGEQLGFMGTASLLGVMLFVILKCFMVAFRAPDNLGRLIAGGVAGLLLFQTFVNVAVVTELLPNTGMPFPFLSYGGTSMLVHMAAIGMVLNVGLARARAAYKPEEDQKVPLYKNRY